MALSSQIADRFNALFEVGKDARRGQLQADLNGLTNDLARRGPGGVHYEGAQRIYRKEFEAQCALAWECLQRVHQTAGQPYDDTLRQDLQTEIARCIKNSASRCEANRGSYLRRVSCVDERLIARTTLAESEALMLRRFQIEVDLYVDTLENSRLQVSSMVSRPTYNFHAPVGAVQTGAYSTATVTQTWFIGDEQKEALRSALVQVTGHVQDLPAAQELVTNCVEELEASEPRKDKLERWFGVLANAIQGISSAQPAYQALRAAAAGAGISLP